METISKKPDLSLRLTRSFVNNPSLISYRWQLGGKGYFWNFSDGGGGGLRRMSIEDNENALWD